MAVQSEETEVLRALSHPHVVELVETFYQAPYLGLLIWPVAKCNLAILLDVVDALSWRNIYTDDDELFNQVIDLAETDVHHLGVHFPHVLCCLSSAVAYLHRNNVRHKDIKPSNILIAEDGIRLADFGTAKDFTSGLTRSSASRERGTLRYCAPGNTEFTTSGRPADIFSLAASFSRSLWLRPNRTHWQAWTDSDQR